MQSLLDTAHQFLGPLFNQLFTHKLPQFLPALLVLLLVYGLLWLLEKRRLQQAGKNRFRDQWQKILVVLVGALALILALPLESATTGQLLTLAGLLLTAVVTLSSSTVAANAMASFMLRALSNFGPGDYIKVGDYFGRVTEQNLFHTEIQTEDRDLLTLPNVYLASHPIKVIQASGTIISAEVSLGYDVDYHLVEGLLLDAAASAKLEDGFVQVLELGDFSVVYRVAGVLSPAKHLLSTRSLLRKQMMDSLHSHGVEIVSPNFMNQRQVSVPVIPERSFVITQNTDNTEPDALIFDKAEKAQQLKELQENYQELQETLAQTIEEEGKDSAAVTRLERRAKALRHAMQILEHSQDSKSQ